VGPPGHDRGAVSRLGKVLVRPTPAAPAGRFRTTLRASGDDEPGAVLRRLAIAVGDLEVHTSHGSPPGGTPIMSRRHICSISCPAASRATKRPSTSCGMKSTK
jgi:hypothetical protein